MAGSKKGPQAKGKPPPAKGRQQPVRRPPAPAPRSQKRGVMAPVATNVSNGRSGSKTVRLVERERVATLAGSADFKVQKTFQINPALSSFLPWLSTMAQLYEKYRVKSIRVMYHNLCGTNAAGNVLMAYDPDVLDGAPADAVSFSQSTRYVDGAPWRMLTLNIPGSNQSLFTRSGSHPAGSDLKTYDYGQIHIACEAMADESTVGYIEIAYDLELFERQSAPVPGGQYTFRPKVYAGVPDPDQAVVLTHDVIRGPTPGGSDQTRITFDGALPLVALVDDIGVKTFNGSVVLPSGTYAFSAAFPRGAGLDGEFSDASEKLPPGTHHEPLAPALVSRVVSSLRLTYAEGTGFTWGILGGTSSPPVRDRPRFRWVDSTGDTIDAVGIADLTGVYLVTSFSIVFDGLGVVSVNGRPIVGSGTFTTTMLPSKPGEGIWPTALITQISE